VFHPCFRHDIQTTAVVLYLTSAGRSARSTLYTVGKRAFPVSGATVCRHSRFSDNDSRPFCFPFLLRHYHMTHLLLLPVITSVWTPVVLAV